MGGRSTRYCWWSGNVPVRHGVGGYRASVEQRVYPLPHHLWSAYYRALLHQRVEVRQISGHPAATVQRYIKLGLLGSLLHPWFRLHCFELLSSHLLPNGYWRNTYSQRRLPICISPQLVIHVGGGGHFHQKDRSIPRTDLVWS